MPDIVSIAIPRTIFGVGAIENIGDMAKTFSPTKVLIITGPRVAKLGIADRVRLPLEKAGLTVEIYDSVRPNPTFSSTDKLLKKVKAGNYDLLIGVGGGSSMDSARMASVTVFTGKTMRGIFALPWGAKIEGRIMPKILVPTTSGSGAEWSSGLAIYEDKPGGHGEACINNSPQCLADMVIIDPALTLDLPQSITVDTGMDTFTHAVEAYTGFKASVFSDMMASTAVKLVADNIRLAYSKGSRSIEARYNMSIAAPLAISALVMAGLGLGHMIDVSAHINVTHGTGLAIILPATMEYNLIANPAKYAKIAELMGENISGLSLLDAAAKSVEAVRRLTRDLGLPQKLRDVGMTEADIPEIAKKVIATRGGMIAAMNYRDANVEDIAQILRAAL
jgi:alcohol dehydrogenase